MRANISPVLQSKYITRSCPVQLERCLDGKPEDSIILEMMLLVQFLLMNDIDIDIDDDDVIHCSSPTWLISQDNVDSNQIEKKLELLRERFKAWTSLYHKYHLFRVRATVAVCGSIGSVNGGTAFAEWRRSTRSW